MSLFERAQNSTFKRLVNGDLSVENAVIIWTNFEGRPTNFNPAGGKRTFVLVLDEQIAGELKAEGWNIKYREPKEDGDDPLIFTEIVVNMESTYPPKVTLYSEFRGRKSANPLDSDTIKELDKIDIENVDLIIHPYAHGRSTTTSVKGYARAIYVVQAQDGHFDGKYSNWGSDDDIGGPDEDDMPY